MQARATRATTPAADERRRQREIAILIAALTLALDKLSRRYIRQDIPVAFFLQSAYHVLEQSHRQARLLGTPSFQGVAAFTFFMHTDQRIAQDQMRFLKGFESDLRDGRYAPKAEGGTGAAARKARFGLYANRLVGTANQAWLDAVISSGERVLWQLGADEDHCRDCIEESRAGWRIPDQLTRVPGDGTTRCLVNCHCRLVTESGMQSLHLP